MEFYNKFDEAAKAITEADKPAEFLPPKMQPGDRPICPGVALSQTGQGYYWAAVKAIIDKKKKLSGIEARKAQLLAEGKFTPKEQLGLSVLAGQLEWEVNTASNHFWDYVKCSFPETFAVKNLTIREGWFVVEHQPEPEPVRVHAIRIPGGLMGLAMLSQILGDPAGCGDPNCPNCGVGRNKAAEPPKPDRGEQILAGAKKVRETRRKKDADAKSKK